MQTLRQHPHIYQLDTLTWLNQLSADTGKNIRLIDIKDHQWKSIRSAGFDLVWLMGIWERSEDSKLKALSQSWIRDYFGSCQTDFRSAVQGSPYAVKSYNPDPRIATADELREVRTRINHLGLRLILDFVPNHTSTDHAWVQQYPDMYVHAGPENHSAKAFEGFLSGSYKIAFGKDPYFEPWTDTAQLDYRNAQTCSRMTEVLSEIARLCDGVRCDMAMLISPDVFRDTWEQVPPETAESKFDFWKHAVESVRRRRKDFVFIGEVYWGRQEEFYGYGFNYCYDKEFYDALKSQGSAELMQTVRSMSKSRRNNGLRFTENHDEERSVSVFGKDKAFAAAATVWTLPGMRFLQDGQKQGCDLRKPVQIAVQKPYKTDDRLKTKYEILLKFADEDVMHEGIFRILKAQSCDEKNPVPDGFLAWSWELHGKIRIAVINFSAQTVAGRLPMKIKTSYTTIEILDLIDGSLYKRDADQLTSPGLFIQLNPWQVHLFSFKT